MVNSRRSTKQRFKMAKITENVNIYLDGNLTPRDALNVRTEKRNTIGFLK